MTLFMTSERLTDRLGEARNKGNVLAVFERKREKPTKEVAGGVQVTSKKEMARLIAQMADTPETTQWLRERNEAMRRSLRDISLSAVQYDAAGGRSGHGDSTAEKVLKRAEVEECIRINERAIRDRLRLHSDLSLVMAETLDQDERTIIWAKYAEHLPWWRIERITFKSISSCKRLANSGMEKLCDAWDRKKEQKKTERA